MRAATAALALVLLGAAGCEPRHADGPPREARVSDASPPPRAAHDAVNPSDSFCLSPTVLESEPVETEAIRERYLHWLICDYDRQKTLRYLDILVARNDPAATHAKSVILADTDVVESERLRTRAESLGYRSPTFAKGVRELAEP